MCSGLPLDPFGGWPNCLATVVHRSGIYSWPVLTTYLGGHCAGAKFLNRIRVQELNSLIANRLRGRDCVRTAGFRMQELVLTLVSGLQSLAALRPTM
jgi:hypothetical protein